jgi:ABC-type spermidine/putrescine transport system permease subunit I
MTLAPVRGQNRANGCRRDFTAARVRAVDRTTRTLDRRAGRAGLLARLQDNRNALGLLFLLPAARCCCVFLTYPLGLGTWLGFTDAKIGRAGSSIGIENFEFLLGDAVTRSRCSTRCSIRSSRASSSSARAVARAAAEQAPAVQGVLRAVVLLPFIVPTALSAIAFWWIYDSQFSIISWALLKMGLINEYIDFLGQPWHARFATIAANIWRGVPFVAITLLAGPADDLAVVLRGREPRRRDRLAASSATSRCRCSRRSSRW